MERGSPPQNSHFPMTLNYFFQLHSTSRRNSPKKSLKIFTTLIFQKLFINERRIKFSFKSFHFRNSDKNSHFSTTLGNIVGEIGGDLGGIFSGFFDFPRLEKMVIFLKNFPEFSSNFFSNLSKFSL